MDIGRLCPGLVLSSSRGEIEINPEEKFWKLRELVGRLLLFLELASTLHLAKAQVTSRDIFRESLSSKIWENLIKQSNFSRNTCHRVAQRLGQCYQPEDVRILVAIF